MRTHFKIIRLIFAIFLSINSMHGSFEADSCKIIIDDLLEKKCNLKTYYFTLQEKIDFLHNNNILTVNNIFTEDIETILHAMLKAIESYSGSTEFYDLINKRAAHQPIIESSHEASPIVYTCQRMNLDPSNDRSMRKALRATISSNFNPLNIRKSLEFLEQNNILTLNHAKAICTIPVVTLEYRKISDNEASLATSILQGRSAYTWRQSAWFYSKNLYRSSATMIRSIPSTIWRMSTRKNFAYLIMLSFALASYQWNTEIADLLVSYDIGGTMQTGINIAAENAQVGMQYASDYTSMGINTGREWSSSGYETIRQTCSVWWNWLSMYQPNFSLPSWQTTSPLPHKITLELPCEYDIEKISQCSPDDLTCIINSLPEESQNFVFNLTTSFKDMLKNNHIKIMIPRSTTPTAYFEHLFKQFKEIVINSGVNISAVS